MLCCVWLVTACVDAFASSTCRFKKYSCPATSIATATLVTANIPLNIAPYLVQRAVKGSGLSLCFEPFMPSAANSIGLIEKVKNQVACNSAPRCDSQDPQTIVAPKRNQEARSRGEIKRGRARSDGSMPAAQFSRASSARLSSRPGSRPASLLAIPAPSCSAFGSFMM
jgi:hypothetical protein